MKRLIKKEKVLEWNYDLSQCPERCHVMVTVMSANGKTEIRILHKKRKRTGEIKWSSVSDESPRSCKPVAWSHLPQHADTSRFIEDSEIKETRKTRFSEISSWRLKKDKIDGVFY